MMNLKKPGQIGKRLGRRCTAPWPAALFSRVAEGMQKTQGDHPSCRGQVPGGVRL